MVEASSGSICGFSIIEKQSTKSKPVPDELGLFVQRHAGCRAIGKVLVANNGLAATKKIRSIRKWSLETFGIPSMVKLFIMATRDDIEANSEFVRLADGYVEVPGGPNSFNYANVELIVSIARQLDVQAVWAGWGHASENPRLPRELSKLVPPIAFIGPPSKPMHALGDKISSMILAQSAQVKTIAWSGSGIQLSESELLNSFDMNNSAAYKKACCVDAEDGLIKAKQIGVPLMIKASEGGGGKGIRRVDRLDQFKTLFGHVQNEVPGSPIFLMRVAEDSRHLEIQLVCDQHGNAVTLFGRDCSVQRRHQKIIEEAPITIAPADIVLQLEEAAIRLGKLVGYENVGTVEYLYDPEEQTYSFLELNPRLQVEHPTTEMISNVNIPALQLLIAMGIPLFRIRDIRLLYGQNPDSSEPFDMALSNRMPPKGQVIAARVTAENTLDGFKPNGGQLSQVRFPAGNKAWGYFSVYSHGRIHNFSDSQFGHLFAHGDNRLEACKLLHNVLRETTIDADFRTNVEYVTSLLSHPTFVTNVHSTVWLDGLIKHGHSPDKPNPVEVAIYAAAMLSHLVMEDRQLSIRTTLQRRQYPTTDQLEKGHSGSFLYVGMQYRFNAEISGPGMMVISMGAGQVSVKILPRPDGSWSVSLAEQCVLIQLQRTSAFLHLTINGSDCLIEFEKDPSSIRSPSSGRLVRFLVDEGTRVVEDMAIAEIEVMKMYMPVHSKGVGLLAYRCQPGSYLVPGDIIGKLTLDDQEDVATATPVFDGKLPFDLVKEFSLSEAYQNASERVQWAIEGMEIKSFDLEMVTLLQVTSNPSLLFERSKQILANYRTRIPADTFVILWEAAESCDRKRWTEARETFSSAASQELNSLELEHDAAGGDYAVATVVQLLEGFVAKERIFESELTIDGPLKKLFQLYPADFVGMAQHVWSHAQLDARMCVLIKMVEHLRSMRPTCLQDPSLLKVLRSLAAFHSKEYGRVARKSRELLLAAQIPSTEEMFKRMEGKLVGALGFLGEDERRLAFVQDMVEGFATHMDVLPHFFHHPLQAIRRLAIEIYVKRLYTPHILACSDFNTNHQLDMFEWAFCTHVQAEADGKITIGMVADSPPLGENRSNGKIGGSRRKGFMRAIDDVKEAEAAIRATCLEIENAGEEDENVLYLALKASTSEEEDRSRSVIQETIQHLRTLLHGCRMRRITAAFSRLGASSVGFYTFRKTHDYFEDLTIRHIEPAMAYLLECHRLFNYNIEFGFSDFSGQVRIYLGTEKSKAACKRLFIRLVVRPNHAMRQFDSMEHFAPEAERILEEVLQAVEAVQAQHHQHTYEGNHLFINIVPVFYNQPEDVLAVFEALVAMSQERWSELRITQAEVRMNLSRRKGEAAGRYRFFLSNKTGYVAQISGYTEVKDPSSGFKTLVGLDPRSPGKFHGYPVSFRYPLLSLLQMKRNRVRTLDTPYVYDFPLIIEEAIKRAWRRYLQHAEQGVTPDRFLEWKELILDRSAQLQQTSRSAGLNTCGMVAWLMRCFTPDAPIEEGREIVVIANDISFEIGSFGVEEDRLFEAASRLAREKGIPRIYLSANSGARIGLAEELRGLFQVAWKDPQNPPAGFDYLYLSEEDYASINPAIIHCDPVVIPETGEIRHRILDIVGAKHGLGVENLQGSALIASETSKAYDDIFTLSFATGRSVGIGAYLIRLGQRTIQKDKQPIILTGVGALNNLLGREVYRNNLQIGGPQIMYANGVSHRIVKDDLQGLEEIIEWLSCVPLTMKRPIPPTLVSTDDPHRDVEYHPSPDTPYDPRWLIEGRLSETGQWTDGLVDRGSFKEYLGGWAKTVIVGRARLGGIPIGLIAAETRTVELIVPADPANPASEAQIIHQAGQVWFPDSAFKTAQAIRDFTKGERLPIIILANWRGFSGGQRDLYDQILKFGAMIIDGLRDVQQPVFVYLPPGAELRGGAWVVLDTKINPGFIEMFADPTARGGVLEPEGLVGIKFRQQHLHSLMEKLDPVCRDLADQSDVTPGPELQRKLQARKSKLLPIYRQVACQFADAHDRPGRMKAKKIIEEIVPWRRARSFFYSRLCRRLAEAELALKIKDKPNSKAIITDLLRRQIPEYSSLPDAEALKAFEDRKQDLIDEIDGCNVTHLRSQLEKLTAELGIDLVKSTLNDLAW